MVICLERGANDLHMVQLMTLPLPSSLAWLKSRLHYRFNPSGTGFAQVVLEKRLLNRCLSVFHFAGLSSAWSYSSKEGR